MNAESDQFEWTPFSRGYVFWEHSTAEHWPPENPDDIAGLREWLEGFMQAFADYPDDPRSWINPSFGEPIDETLTRMLPAHPALPTLLAMLRRPA